MKQITFEDFLKEKCGADGGYEGVLDDDYEEAFERWLTTKDVAVIIDYGNQAIKEAYTRGMDVILLAQKPIK